MNHEPPLQKHNSGLCRTCMSSEPNLTSLFSILSLSNKEEALNSILYKCTSIQVCPTDVLPQSICNSCLEKLAICYLYRELCFDTQTRLQQLYESEKHLSYIDNNTVVHGLALGSLDSPHIDTKVTDYVTTYRTIKSPYPINDNAVITPQPDLLPDSKPIGQDFETNTTVLEQTCDIKYIPCDNQNCYEESDDSDKVSSNFTCVICSKKCNSKYSLNRHLKTHSDAEELKCPVCLKKFSRAADVKRHLSTHTGEKPYLCSFCQCSFTQSGSLSAHIRQKHKTEEVKQQLPKPHGAMEERPYLCSICGNCFRHSSTLKLHMRRHLGEKPYECQICKLRFVSRARLRSHIRVHSGERPFVCHICNKNFAQSTVLSRHLKAHADIKPHKCDYCSKRFLIPYYLNIHIRQHTGEKPLNCSSCSKRFACPKTLKQHEKGHSDEKPYLCITCGKSFRRTQHLKVHMKQHGKIE